MKAFNQYLYPTLASFILFLLLSDYLLLRRGYYDLYIFNKASAGAATVVLGVVLLIGPLVHSFKQFAGLLPLRKELGIIAFVMAFLHPFVSFFFLSDHFPLARFQTQWVVFFFGVASFYLIVLLAFITERHVKQHVDPKLWWALQQWGVRLAFFFGALHVGVMKFPGLGSWFAKGGDSTLASPFLPPASLLVGLFVGFVFFVRIASALSKERTKSSFVIGGVCLLLSYCILFLRGFLLLL